MLSQKNQAPLAVALRVIAETRQLLASLITSSESFDYHQAKKALVTLDRKFQELGKLQDRLESKAQRRAPHAPNVCVVDFSKASSPREDSRAR